MTTDFILNGQGFGPVGQNLSSGDLNDPNYLRLQRPYFNERGMPVVNVFTGRKHTVEKGVRRARLEEVPVAHLGRMGMHSPVANATTLRKEEWLELDKVVLKAARYRLRAWADLQAANSFGGFNAMGKMVLEHETMSDPGEAMVDMDALSTGRDDTPKFQLEGLPLPITHSDFWVSSRRLAVSRNTGTPIDTTMGEAAGRRVAEAIEKTTIGNQTGVTYGGNSTQVGGYGRTSQVYGYTTFGSRLTKTNLTTPTGSNAASTVADVLAMRQQLYNAKFFGPYMLYHSTDWDNYLDNDYILTGGNVATQTLRERLKGVEGVQDVRRLDFLFASAPTADSSSSSFTGPGGADVTGNNAFTLLMVQMTPDVCRAVGGMGITTVQWETIGGLQLNFKVMAIQVPQLRADFYGNCGILQATTS